MKFTISDRRIAAVFIDGTVGGYLESNYGKVADRSDADPDAD